eukprot:scaffold15273_cov107-Isochrysis_galbana.AAC.2
MAKSGSLPLDHEVKSALKQNSTATLRSPCAGPAQGAGPCTLHPAEHPSVRARQGLPSVARADPVRPHAPGSECRRARRLRVRRCPGIELVVVT